MREVTVVTLTDAARTVAGRLAPALPGAEFLHRPATFQETVRNRFVGGRRLVMICAAGIVVRTLAPVLRDKHNDPAVLVIDEQGRFVVALISGHEGGANDWARQLAEELGAHCIITGARPYTHCVLVAGIGCERGCAREHLERLARESLASHDLAPADLTAIASIDIKEDETGLLALAAGYGIAPAFYPACELRRYTKRLSERSDVVFKATGCYGVAEAAALAHAEQLTGRSGELIISKRKGGGATFALARACGDRQ
jgi:cobalt-precorrin 5A hydrolase